MVLHLFFLVVALFISHYPFSYHVIKLPDFSSNLMPASKNYPCSKLLSYSTWILFVLGFLWRSKVKDMHQKVSTFWILDIYAQVHCLPRCPNSIWSLLFFRTSFIIYMLKKLCPQFQNVPFLYCELFQLAKHHRLPCVPRVSSPFKLIHYVWGPCPIISKTGFHYFMTSYG